MLRLGDLLHQQGIDLLVVIIPIFAGIAVNNRAYSVEVLHRPTLGYIRAAQALLFTGAAVLGVVFYFQLGETFSRLVFSFGIVASFALLAAARIFIGNFIGRRCNWSFVNEVLLIDDATIFPEAGQLVVFADQSQLSPKMDDPVMFDRLGRLFRYCDRVVLACAPEKRIAWSRMLKGLDVDVEVLTPELGQLGALAMRRFRGRTTVMVSCGPLRLWDRALKRALDVTLAAFALACLAPLMIMVASAIKLESKGPIFFRQERVGQGNRLFKIYKFRSMRSEASDLTGAVSASRSDDRITKVGHLIRKTSIDELPQLINVLLGDMSIVGPRPHALASTAEAELFWSIDQRYWDRHVIKPGITGLAQVQGYRGATMTRADLTNRLQADLDYLAGWTIWKDIKIIAKTFGVLSHKNAF
ncbi:MAG TPA: exopolysaccharide biosynthesis polyprenyl glycosylphosphotransferase [Allosphingosinicella sp.]|nr:exopolysaccharide biosynthesis polyprenyl glycosylphosphotransferase [Allosphingosinicella sp.]